MKGIFVLKPNNFTKSEHEHEQVKEKKYSVDVEVLCGWSLRHCIHNIFFYLNCDI